VNEAKEYLREYVNVENAINLLVQITGNDIETIITALCTASILDSDGCLGLYKIRDDDFCASPSVIVRSSIASSFLGKVPAQGFNQEIDKKYFSQYMGKPSDESCVKLNEFCFRLKEFNNAVKAIGVAVSDWGTHTDNQTWGENWEDIIITITAQSTLFLENKKTGRAENIHQSKLGLGAKKGSRVNQRYKLLGDMCKGDMPKTSPKTATEISRLRLQLKKFFKINSDPFYVNNQCYHPLFCIKFQLAEQDKRLETAAIKSGKQISYEQNKNEIDKLIQQQRDDDESTYSIPTRLGIQDDEPQD